MSSLNQLSNGKKTAKKSKRVGRGPSSGMGKTSGRGQNGAGSRSGYKRRYGKEGGNLPMFRKLPTRGFTRGRFTEDLCRVNLWQIEKFYKDGEEVNYESLKKHGFFGGKIDGIKILGVGEITKKVTINVDAISKGAKEKLDKAGISYTTAE